MPGPERASPVEPWLLDEAEGVALAYHQAARGDAWAALVAMARDALADRGALEERLRACDRRVSRGYVRGDVGAAHG